MNTVTHRLRTPDAAPTTRRAIRDMLPVALSVAPFGTALGVAMNSASAASLPGAIVTWLIAAGSAQLAALSTLLNNGAAAAAIAAGALVNARLLLYSAGLAHRFREQPAWFRWLAPLTIIDQTYAIVAARPALTGAAFRRYWITISIVLVGVWNLAVVAGMAIGNAVPQASPLQVALPATMVSLLVAHLDDRRKRHAAMVAATVAVLGRFLPAGLGVVAAIAVAMAMAGPQPQDST